MSAGLLSNAREALSMPVQTSYPGVYIDERPSGVHAIVGVSTSVTAFVGAASQGRADTPVRIFSTADFLRAFGPPIDEDNPMGYCVAHFFANGGGEALIVRALNATAVAATVKLSSAEPMEVLVLTAAGAGAWANRAGGTGLEVSIDQAGASNPNDLFNLLLSQWAVDPRTNTSVLVAQEDYKNLSMAPKHSRYVLTALAGSNLVTAALGSQIALTNPQKVPGTSVGAGAVAGVNFTESNNRLRLTVDWGPPVEVVLFGPAVAAAALGGPPVPPKSAAEIVTELNTNSFPNASVAATASQAANVLTISSNTNDMNSAVVITPALTSDASKDLKLGLAYAGTETSTSAVKRPATLAAAAGGFSGGDDKGPVAVADQVPATDNGRGIWALGKIPYFPRFNLLCLPGATSDDVAQISEAMGYCKKERAFLLVDSPRNGFAAIPPNLAPIQALGEHGAIYYPRLQQQETTQGTTRTLNLPTCGAVAGVIARIDGSRGVWKSPAGFDSGIVGVTGLTKPTDDNVSGQLNPKGVNAIRIFPGVGTLIWGARTLKGDDSAASEFKYLAVRRVTDYIASSLYRGTAFAVFQPNGPDLWAELRIAVGTFMRGLFRQGAFQQSAKRAESDSFFVICDETVNPQSEIDLGRVNVVVGFAPLKPAEFVVITITQISQLEE